MWACAPASLAGGRHLFRCWARASGREAEWAECKHPPKTPYLRSAALNARRIQLKSVVDRAEPSGLDFSFGDLSAYPGERLIPFFIERASALPPHPSSD